MYCVNKKVHSNDDEDDEDDDVDVESFLSLYAQKIHKWHPERTMRAQQHSKKIDWKPS